MSSCSTENRLPFRQSKCKRSCSPMRGQAHQISRPSSTTLRVPRSPASSTPCEVEAEAAAQMQRLQDAGIQPSHFDYHKHAHMFPAVLRPLLRAANHRAIRAVRNPFGRVLPLPWAAFCAIAKLGRAFAQLGCPAQFRRRLSSRGEAGTACARTDGSVGVLAHRQCSTLSCSLAIIDSMPEGTWEFVCHPGYNDAELDSVRTRLRQSREKELQRADFA